uniref:tRNA(adenine(34)) deaminase n=1 Tax=Oryza punctata TaxID=4537 RepID=A0A0E0LBR9_ORYPU
MYSSYSAVALALRAAKPSSCVHSTYHHHHHGDGGECHQQELLPLHPRAAAPRFMLDGYLLRHSAHLLLLSARLRPPPPLHPPPHCCRRRVAARCCGGCYNGSSSVAGHVSWRLDPPRVCRCSGHGAGRSSDLGAVYRRRLEARECRCGGGGGRLDLRASCGQRRDAPRLVGRAVRQEVWEYEGGEWPHTSCSMECHADWDWEDEDEDRGLARWEAPTRFRLSRRRSEEDEGDRCRDCHRRKDAESDYYDEDEYSGRQRERRNMNEIHGRFTASDQRRRDQRDYHDDDDYLEFRRWKERRERRDSEFDDAVARRGVEDRRYSEDDRKCDRRRERRDFGYEGAVDVRGEGTSRYTDNNQKSDWRTEDRDYDFDVRREGRHRRNDDQRYVTRHQQRTDDTEEEDVSLLESHRRHDEEHDYDERDIAERRYYSGRRSQKSALHEDKSNRASSSRNTVDTRIARNKENLASRVRWHDNVDRRAQQTSEERDQRYSSSVVRSFDEKYGFNHDDAQLIRVRDSRIGTRDLRVITEDDANLASSSKNTTISQHHSTVDQKSITQKDDSRKSSQKIIELSEVRGTNTEHDSRTQSYHQEDRGRYMENRASSLQSSVEMTSDTRTQVDQHDEVNQQVVALTDSRRRSEKLTDIKMDSTSDVSRTSLTQRNYDEVNQMDIDDRSNSVHNITYITRDKKRYVNQQVIHETDIDVQNVTHVDVSKVRASDISVSRNSQEASETRSDMTNSQLEQIQASNSSMVRGPQSYLEAALHNRVYSTSATDIVNTTAEKHGQVETSTNNAAIASTSESHIQARIEDELQSTSVVNTIGSVQEQIDLTRICTSDSTVVSSSHGLDTRSGQISRTSATNFVDRTRETRDKRDQQITQASSIDRNDQVTSRFYESSQDSRQSLARLKEAGRLLEHNVGLNWQQEESSRVSNDTNITTLEIQSTEDGSSMVPVDVEKRPMIIGSSEQEVRSETTAVSSIPSGSSARQPVNESLLESAARLEKSSTFHVGQFVGEVRKGVSDADTTLTRKNDKSIMEGITRSSSRPRMGGPSDEMWDVQSATSQETFKTADKEEGSSVDGGTTSTSLTPKNETALARKVHKSLWAYVADIVRLGWIQHGESLDSNSNRSVKKSSSSNSQNTEGWISSQERDNEGIQKKTESSKPKDHLMKSHTGESLKKESSPTGSQGLLISESGNVPQIDTSKGDFISRTSKDDAQMTGEKAKQSKVAASPKQNTVGGFSEDSTPTLVDVTKEHFPEHEASTSSMITTKGSADNDTGEGVIAGTSSMPISTEGVGWTAGSDEWRYDPSGAMAPYRHPHTQVMMPHEDTSAVILESAELPMGGSTRFEEKTVVRETPEVIRTDGKDAELKRRKFQRNKQVMKETFDEWEEAYQRDAEQRKTDELFMREALHEAQRAADLWEVPVGAVLVQNGEIIARGCNLVEDLRDSTAHAEIVCIREASNKLKTWRLAVDTTLYVTLEPCAMCAGAILQARVDTVVWGAPNKLLGADGSWVRLFPGDGQTSTLDSANTNQGAGPVHPFHPKISIRRGILSAECSEIMQQFFHLRRRKKQKPESPPHAHPPGRNHPVKFFSKMHHMFGTIFCL